MKLLPAFLFTATMWAQTWSPEISNTRASLRGVSAVDARTVWASGSGGTWLVTTDGGGTWRAAIVPGAEALDFRGLRAIDANPGYRMSAGPGYQSRIYKTSDAGGALDATLTNPNRKASSTPSPSWMPNRPSCWAISSTGAPKS
jgi:photosystem II stability/assembly factor-like uncharacterized protein